MTKKLTDSQFYMWRTLFALSHADGVVSNEEVRFMVEALEDIPFSDEQKTLLRDDIKSPRDPLEMFAKVTDMRDQAKFFQFARDIVHVDGDYGKAEQDLLLKLQKLHIKTADVDKLVGKMDLELESEGAAPSKPTVKKKKSDILSSFRKKFLEDF
jgi:uncharacterized membrane protein YebE (DUF533 family)